MARSMHLPRTAMFTAPLSPIPAAAWNCKLLRILRASAYGTSSGRPFHLCSFWRLKTPCVKWRYYTGGSCVRDNTNNEYVLVGARGRSDSYLCMSIVPVCTVYIILLILEHAHFILIVGVGKERYKLLGPWWNVEKAAPIISRTTLRTTAGPVPAGTR